MSGRGKGIKLDAAYDARERARVARSMAVVTRMPYISRAPFPPATSGPVAAVMIPLVAELEAAAAAGELTRDAWSVGWERATEALRDVDESDERSDWLEPLYRLGAPLGFMRE